ncbi:MAG: hypothetical protein KGI54_08290 [Pseudomonadota bacterium]|nr:hypothetical protein [Pseudomonadota bacterium]
MANNTATEETLSNLHAELAEALKEAIQPEPIVDRETGEVIGKKRNPAALNVARQFLKDNGIQALPESNKGLQGLVEELPDFESTADIISLKEYMK